jgi:hypothetical protein
LLISVNDSVSATDNGAYGVTPLFVLVIEVPVNTDRSKIAAASIGTNASICFLLELTSCGTCFGCL